MTAAANASARGAAADGDPPVDDADRVQQHVECMPPDELQRARPPHGWVCAGTAATGGGVCNAANAEGVRCSVCGTVPEWVECAILAFTARARRRLAPLRSALVQCRTTSAAETNALMEGDPSFDVSFDVTTTTDGHDLIGKRTSPRPAERVAVSDRAHTHSRRAYNPCRNQRARALMREPTRALAPCHARTDARRDAATTYGLLSGRLRAPYEARALRTEVARLTLGATAGRDPLASEECAELVALALQGAVLHTLDATGVATPVLRTRSADVLTLLDGVPFALARAWRDALAPSVLALLGHGDGRARPPTAARGATPKRARAHGKDATAHRRLALTEAEALARAQTDASALWRRARSVRHTPWTAIDRAPGGGYRAFHIVTTVSAMTDERFERRDELRSDAAHGLHATAEAAAEAVRAARERHVVALVREAYARHGDAPVLLRATARADDDGSAGLYNVTAPQQIHSGTKYKSRVKRGDGTRSSAVFYTEVEAALHARAQYEHLPAAHAQFLQVAGAPPERRQVDGTSVLVGGGASGYLLVQKNGARWRAYDPYNKRRALGHFSTPLDAAKRVALAYDAGPPDQPDADEFERARALRAAHNGVDAPASPTDDALAAQTATDERTRAAVRALLAAPVPTATLAGASAMVEGDSAVTTAVAGTTDGAPNDQRPTFHSNEAWRALAQLAAHGAPEFDAFHAQLSLCVRLVWMHESRPNGALARVGAVGAFTESELLDAFAAGAAWRLDAHVAVELAAQLYSAASWEAFAAADPPPDGRWHPRDSRIFKPPTVEVARATPDAPRGDEQRISVRWVRHLSAYMHGASAATRRVLAHPLVARTLRVVLAAVVAVGRAVPYLADTDLLALNARADWRSPADRAALAYLNFGIRLMLRPNEMLATTFGDMCVEALGRWSTPNCTKKDNYVRHVDGLLVHAPTCALAARRPDVRTVRAALRAFTRTELQDAACDPRTGCVCLLCLRNALATFAPYGGRTDEPLIAGWTRAHITRDAFVDLPQMARALRALVARENGARAPGTRHLRLGDVTTYMVRHIGIIRRNAEVGPTRACADARLTRTSGPRVLMRHYLHHDVPNARFARLTAAFGTAADGSSTVRALCAHAFDRWRPPHAGRRLDDDDVATLDDLLALASSFRAAADPWTLDGVLDVARADLPGTLRALLCAAREEPRLTLAATRLAYALVMATAETHDEAAPAQRAMAAWHRADESALCALAPPTPPSAVDATTSTSEVLAAAPLAPIPEHARRTRGEALPLDTIAHVRAVPVVGASAVEGDALLIDVHNGQPVLLATNDAPWPSLLDYAVREALQTRVGPLALLAADVVGVRATGVYATVCVRWRAHDASHDRWIARDALPLSLRRRAPLAPNATQWWACAHCAATWRIGPSSPIQCGHCLNDVRPAQRAEFEAMRVAAPGCKAMRRFVLAEHVTAMPALAVTTDPHERARNALRVETRLLDLEGALGVAPLDRVPWPVRLLDLGMQVGTKGRCGLIDAVKRQRALAHDAHAIGEAFLALVLRSRTVAVDGRKRLYIPRGGFQHVLRLHIGSDDGVLAELASLALASLGACGALPRAHVTAHLRHQAENARKQCGTTAARALVDAYDALTCSLVRAEHTGYGRYAHKQCERPVDVALATDDLARIATDTLAFRNGRLAGVHTRVARALNEESDDNSDYDEAEEAELDDMVRADDDDYNDHTTTDGDDDSSSAAPPNDDAHEVEAAAARALVPLPARPKHLGRTGAFNGRRDLDGNDQHSERPRSITTLKGVRSAVARYLNNIEHPSEHTTITHQRRASPLDAPRCAAAIVMAMHVVANQQSYRARKLTVEQVQALFDALIVDRDHPAYLRVSSLRARIALALARGLRSSNVCGLVRARVKLGIETEAGREGEFADLQLVTTASKNDSTAESHHMPIPHMGCAHARMCDNPTGAAFDATPQRGRWCAACEVLRYRSDERTSPHAARLPSADYLFVRIATPWPWEDAPGAPMSAPEAAAARGRRCHGQCVREASRPTPRPCTNTILNAELRHALARARALAPHAFAHDAANAAHEDHWHMLRHTAIMWALSIMSEDEVLQGFRIDRQTLAVYASHTSHGLPTGATSSRDVPSDAPAAANDAARARLVRECELAHERVGALPVLPHALPTWERLLRRAMTHVGATADVLAFAHLPLGILRAQLGTAGPMVRLGMLPEHLDIILEAVRTFQPGAQAQLRPSTPPPALHQPAANTTPPHTKRAASRATAECRAAEQLDLVMPYDACDAVELLQQHIPASDPLHGAFTEHASKLASHSTSEDALPALRTEDEVERWLAMPECSEEGS